MGFGLNVAPAIMKSNMKTVLSKDDAIQQGKSAYTNSIYVSESIAFITSCATTSSWICVDI